VHLRGYPAKQKAARHSSYSVFPEDTNFVLHTIPQAHGAEDLARSRAVAVALSMLFTFRLLLCAFKLAVKSHNKPAQ
jgi:hypothetical protein